MNNLKLSLVLIVLLFCQMGLAQKMYVVACSSSSIVEDIQIHRSFEYREIWKKVSENEFESVWGYGILRESYCTTTSCSDRSHSMGHVISRTTDIEIKMTKLGKSICGHESKISFSSDYQDQQNGDHRGQQAEQQQQQGAYPQSQAQPGSQEDSIYQEIIDN